MKQRKSSCKKLIQRGGTIPFIFLPFPLPPSPVIHILSEAALQQILQYGNIVLAYTFLAAWVGIISSSLTITVQAIYLYNAVVPASFTSHAIYQFIKDNGSKVIKLMTSSKSDGNRALKYMRNIFPECVNFITGNQTLKTFYQHLKKYGTIHFGIVALLLVTAYFEYRKRKQIPKNDTIETFVKSKEMVIDIPKALKTKSHLTKRSHLTKSKRKSTRKST